MTDDLASALAQLDDASRQVRSIALEPFSDLTRDEIEEFRRTWETLLDKRRWEIVTAMVEQAETDVRMNFHAVLRLGMSDKDARVRKQAIEGLWEDERPTLVRPLVHLSAADPAAEVRAAAAISLGRFVLLGVLDEIPEEPARLAEEALRNAWNRDGELIEVRRRALEGLAYCGTAEIHPLIHAAYYHDDPRMRQSALFAMGRDADSRWNKIVLAELSSEEAAMRFEAAVAAGEMSLRAAVRPLVRALADPDVQVREAAVSALGKIGGPIARRTLRALIEDPDEPLAEVAVEALDELMFVSDGVTETLTEFPKTALERREGRPRDEDDWDEDSDFDPDADDVEDDADDVDWEDELDEDLDGDDEDDPDWDVNEDEDDEIGWDETRSTWASQ